MAVAFPIYPAFSGGYCDWEDWEVALVGTAELGIVDAVVPVVVPVHGARVLVAVGMESVEEEMAGLRFSSGKPYGCGCG